MDDLAERERNKYERKLRVHGTDWWKAKLSEH